MRLARAALHLVFLLNLATIGFLVIEARSDSASEGSSCADPSACVAVSAGTQASLDEQLAARYAPVVYLPALDRPCVAGGNAFSPLPVDAVLNNPEVSLRSVEDHGLIQPAPGSSDLFDAGSEEYFASYLDFPGNPLKPGCRFERDGLRFAAGYDSVAYARLFPDEDADSLVLQYWFFYYFNDWNNKHEGDWELVQLSFASSDVRQALVHGPTSIGLSQHRSGEIAGWEEGKVSKEGDRPVVFVARGSHANYFSPGLYLGRGEAGRGLGCDDASSSSRRVPLSVQVLPTEPRGPTDAFAWMQYKGYWGETETASEGSTAPSTKQTWLHPLDWQDRLKSSSVKLPTRGLIGPDAARAFCDVVSIGSEFLLPLYHNLPSFSFLALGVVSAGLGGSLATTWYLAPRLRPLRSRRQLVKAFAAGLRAYWRKSYVFVTIGLTAFPLGFILTPIERLLRELTPVLELSPLALVAGRTAVTLPLEGIDIALAAVLVTAATSMAIAHMAAEPRLRLNELLWHRLPGLLITRFVLLAIGVCLCLTVVGIPLAIRQMVRWAFLEQAILVDRLSLRGSFAASAKLVEGRSIWLGGTLLLLGSGALLVAPMLGIGLMMGFKSLAPAYVNLIAAGVYALVVPFVAITMTLIYRELQRGQHNQD